MNLDFNFSDLGFTMGLVISWHRKHRPQKFSQLDQVKVREQFVSLLKSGKLAQVYLFTGPKGTGKTSAARILALTVNCQQNTRTDGPLQEACGVCSSCKSLLTGANTNLIEMDAASNRGIDDIRALRERINLLPTQGSKTVYIIDEVHMLTTEAFNALLKTLEEPPDHVVFCLCTTELHKLPATVVSRCTVINYQLATEAEIIASLERVIKSEKLEKKITDLPEVLALIADQAEGSFRDAVKLLEQLASQEDIISPQAVIKLSSGADSLKLDQLFDCLMAGDTKGSLELVEHITKNAGQPNLVCKSLCQKTVGKIKAAIAEGKPIDSNWFKLIEVFTKAFTRFREVPIASLPLEMAVVELGLAIGKVEQSPPPPPSQTSKTHNQTNHKSSTNVTPKDDNLETTNQAREPYQDLKQPDDQKGKISTKNTSDKQVTFDEIQKSWQQILVDVASYNHGLASLLKQTVLVECQDNLLHLSVAYKFHQEQLEQERHLRVFEDVINKRFASKLRVRVTTTARNQTASDNITANISQEDVALVEAVADAFGVGG